MKLHSYLEQVIGSKAAIGVIRALLTHDGKVFTVRRLAETAGVSASEASLVVKQLEDAGVLNLQPVGRSFLVTPNEQSFVLQKILKPIIDAESASLDELIKLLRRTFGKTEKDGGISSVYLFGSVVRGEDKKDSDIDLFVIASDLDKASAFVSKAQDKIAAVFNKQLSPLIFSEHELASKKKRSDDKLIDSITSEHILVVGEDLLGAAKGK